MGIFRCEEESLNLFMNSPTPDTSTHSHSVNASHTENPSTDKGVSKRVSLTLSDGILIAIGSASAYLWTFQYENGFASYFGIPPQFIIVGLGNVLLIAALLAGFVVSMFSMASGLISLLFPAISQIGRAHV